MILLKFENDNDFLPEESVSLIKISKLLTGVACHLNLVFIEINADFFICFENFMSVATVSQFIFFLFSLKILKKHKFRKSSWNIFDTLRKL